MVITPYIAGALVDHAAKTEADNFLMLVEQSRIQETLPAEKGEFLPEPPDPLREACIAYNAQIWEERQSGLRDPWSYQQTSIDLSQFGAEEEIFAALSIPKIGLSLPIYLGASNDHLTSGAAHLTQTSLPIGGSSTNCVLAGHRGWHGAAFFRDVTMLQAGDEVILTNLWEELHYTVTETRIIQPDDVDSIKIQENRDLVTLLTCYYPSPNEKIRFLVICERERG